MADNNQYLRKHHDTWVYRRRVPKAAEHLFEGMKDITHSLGTSSVKLARIKRDKINGELAAKLEGSYSPERIKFKTYLSDVSPFVGALKDGNTLDYDDVLPRNSIANAAYREAVYGEKDHLFTITIKESLNNLLGHKKNMGDDTRSKLQSNLSRFLLYLSVGDVALKDIDKRTVVQYIEHLACEYAHGTITAHLSRLRSIWTHAYQMGEIKDKISPFCDHDLSHYKGEPPKRKQLFDSEQLRRVLEECPDNLKDLTRLALYTGARISELCAAEVETYEGIKCLVIRKGKTTSAARVIPLVEQVIDIEIPLNLTTKDAGRYFSKFKTTHITKDSTRSFHSLRNHFITAGQRANIDEFDVASLVGHKTGATMSFGHYARADIKKLTIAIKKVARQIEIEWLLL